MRPFQAVVVLCLTGQAANNAVLATEMKPKISYLEMAFLKAKGQSDSLHTTSDWFELWAIDLRHRVENILSALETRPVRVESSLPMLTVDSSEPFSVAMVGDSTIRMQAEGLFALLSNMTTADGEQHCHCSTIAKPCLCFKKGESGRDDSVLLRIDYYWVKEPCVDSEVVADFVYFGCGLHLLHHHPSRPITADKLQRWAQYEKTLQDAVQAFRSNGRLRSGFLGEAFMTTHPILLEKLEDPMLGDILQYAHRNKTTLEECYKTVNEMKDSLEESELEVPAKDICTRGYFADECIVDLNKRGKAVMKRLDVPIVPSYEITIDQDWATGKRDGRHFPPLVPQELSHFLGIISTALKEEKLVDAN